MTIKLTDVHDDYLAILTSPLCGHVHFWAKALALELGPAWDGNTLAAKYAVDKRSEGFGSRIDHIFTTHSAGSKNIVKCFPIELKELAETGAHPGELPKIVDVVSARMQTLVALPNLFPTSRLNVRDNIADLAIQAEFEPTTEEAEHEIDWGLEGASVMLASDLITAWNKAQSGLKLFSASATAASKHMVRQHWGSLYTETKLLRVSAHCLSGTVMHDHDLFCCYPACLPVGNQRCSCSRCFVI